MRLRLALIATAAATLALACTQVGRIGGRGVDAGGRDAALPDAGSVPLDAGSPDPDSGSPLPDAGSTDAGATCEQACQRAAACLGNEVLSECLAGCGNGFADEILMCDARRTGCTYPEECVSSADDREECTRECEQQSFFSCIDATQAAQCADACAAALPAALAQYRTCSAGACTDDSCFAVFVPDGATNVGGCQTTCDDMELFGCIDPIDQSNCRATCTTAPREAINALIGCAKGICDGDGCYLVFLASSAS